MDTMLFDMGVDDDGGSDDDLLDLLHDRYVALDTHFSWTRSAITIQRFIRNKDAICERHHLRKNAAATIIQAAYRGYLLNETCE